MDVPAERIEAIGSKTKIEAGGRIGGRTGIPLIAEGKLEATGGFGTEATQEDKEVFRQTGLAQVIREIGGSSFTVFVDDFHYIPKDVLAGTVQEAPVIEWDEDVLDIVEPYFLFFIRCSSYLQKLAGVT